MDGLDRRGGLRKCMRTPSGIPLVNLIRVSFVPCHCADYIGVHSSVLILRYNVSSWSLSLPSTSVHFGWPFSAASPLQHRPPRQIYKRTLYMRLSWQTQKTTGMNFRCAISTYDSLHSYYSQTSSFCSQRSQGFGRPAATPAYLTSSETAPQGDIKLSTS